MGSFFHFTIFGVQLDPRALKFWSLFHQITLNMSRAWTKIKNNTYLSTLPISSPLFFSSLPYLFHPKFLACQFKWKWKFSYFLFLSLGFFFFSQVDDQFFLLFTLVTFWSKFISINLFPPFWSIRRCTLLLAN